MNICDSIKIGYLTEYKGYIGTIKYDAFDNILYGELINTPKSIIGYHASDIFSLYESYINAVDDYIEKRRELYLKGKINDI